MSAKPIILAVDDDADMLRLVRGDLRRQYGKDYRILSTDGGQPALDALREVSARGEAVALLVVDQRMPGMGGADFLEQAIKLFPECRRILSSSAAGRRGQVRASRTIRASPRA
jgi:thioredoxin reductase (NADPH)